jgi:two-component system chemotaxis response regulator CheY
MAKVLVVDDALFVRAAIKKYVEKAGHEVIGEAGDGQEAIEVFTELKPDAVIMDITMPRMSGLEALKEIKKIESTVKVIMCSAMAQQESIATAIQDGAADFVIKPFTEEQIVAKIKQVLG